MTPTLSPTRECQLIPLDRPAPRLPARVDLVELVKRTFFAADPSAFRLSIRRVSAPST